MIVRCAYNYLSSLRGVEGVPAAVWSDISMDALPLSVGQDYVVYAMSEAAGDVRVYVCTSHDDSYPTPWPVALFTVVDDRRPPAWLAVEQGGVTLWAFPAWATDGSFYERLLDGDEEAEAQFAAARQEMEPR